MYGHCAAFVKRIGSGDANLGPCVPADRTRPMALLDTAGGAGLTTDMDAGELTETARMARLNLSEEERERLRAAVEQMLAYFSHMKEIDVAGLEPTTHALLRENRLRQDVSADPFDSDTLLGNAPEREERFIVIPNVL